MSFPKRTKAKYLTQEENISLDSCVKEILPINKEGWTAVWTKLNNKHLVDT